MLYKALVVITVAVLFKKTLEFLGGYYFAENLSESNVKNSRVLNSDFFEKNNADGKIYLAILGHVYDVSSGEKHYKPGGSYDFFVGRDATRAFVTGDFKNDLNDNLDGLSETQIGEIYRWKNFYDTTYEFIGILDGRFYNSNGEKTNYLLAIEKLNQKNIQNEEKNTQFLNRFPTCNSEWTQEKGLTKVWCTTESGGIKRSWTGYPRLVYNPNSKIESCACVNQKDLDHPSVKVYPNCDAKARSCSPNG